MRVIITLLTIAGFVLAGGCAAPAPKEADERLKFHVSDRAEQLIMEQGKTMAAMYGYSRDSDLVCERWRPVGTHLLKNVCYTRDEMERRRLNHQEEMRRFKRPPPRVVE